MGYKRTLYRAAAPYVKRARTMAYTYVKNKARAYVKKRGARIKKRVLSRATNSKAAKAMGMLMGNSSYKNNSFRNLGTDNPAACISTNTLQFIDLTQVIQGVGEQERESNSIRISGFDVKYNFRNFSGNKLYCNFAMLQPKTLGGAITTNTFFRANQDELNIGFNEPSISVMAKHTRSINADRYIIHWHKRFILGGVTGSTNFDINLSSTKMFKFYYKLNKVMTYSDKGAGETADYPLFIVFWCNFVGGFNIPPAVVAPVANVLQTERDIRMIWKAE